ncbi:MAG: outer membrane beta-barrel protein, partial [Myxococcota bacterium]
YIRAEDGLLLGVSGVGGTGDEDIFALTGTMDHALTDQLTLKGEVRYERGEKDGGANAFFIDNTADTSKDQVLIGAQLVYNF